MEFKTGRRGVVKIGNWVRKDGIEWGVLRVSVLYGVKGMGDSGK
jgi:hypothetical protein